MAGIDLKDRLLLWVREQGDVWFTASEAAAAVGADEARVPGGAGGPGGRWPRVEIHHGAGEVPPDGGCGRQA